MILAPIPDKDKKSAKPKDVEEKAPETNADVAPAAPEAAEAPTSDAAAPMPFAVS
jgi:hypothetical protein